VGCAGRHRSEGRGPKRADAGECRKRRLKFFAHGRIDLGLGEEELGRLSFGQLAALEEAHWERVKREDWRTAQIICAIVNVHRTKEDGAIQPRDVFPWLAPGEKPFSGKKGETPLTPEQNRALVEQITREMGGIVHERNRPLS